MGGRIPWLGLLVLCGAALGGCTALQGPFQAERAGEGGPTAAVHVTFAGADRIGETTLRRRIEDYMLDLSRDPGREAAVYDAALELEGLYHEAGYPDVRVTYQFEPPAAPEQVESVAVRFELDEGPLVTVRELRFEGNAAFPEQELRDLWVRRDTGWFGLGAPLYVPAELHSLANTIGIWYRTRGFLDVEVEPPVIDRPAGATEAGVVIRIHEGHPYYLREVRVAPALQAALGERAPAPPVGKTFTRDVVHVFEQELRTRLRHLGHPEPKVESRVAARDRAAHRVDLELGGEPGPVAIVTEVQVLGDVKTRASMIRGELGHESGDRYDGAKVDAGLRELYLTGLFRRVEITHEWLDDRHARLVARVEELPSRSVELVAGYGSYERLRSGVRYEERNVFGWGYDLVLQGRVSQRGYGTEATWVDPNFLRTHTTLTIGGDYFLREEPSFTDRAYGGTVSLARDLFGHLSARVGYAFRPHDEAKADVQVPADSLVDYTEGRAFVELRWDERDHRLFPRRGHRELLVLDVLDPALGADVELLRARFSAVGIVPLWGSTRVLLRTDQAALWPGESSARVPLQERFFNGGENSVRSFKESRLGPKDPAGIPVGGEFRSTFGVELRVPLVDVFEGAVFADAGNVIRDVSDASFRDMRYGIGAGLRLLLPIGPVRLDAAFNPDRRPDESEWAVHFSVGYPY